MGVPAPGSPGDFLFHAYIGPRPVPPDDPEPYGKWDWPRVDALDQPLYYVGPRTLNNTIGISQTTGLVTSGGGLPLPASAGMWVGPNGNGQGWEYMAYASGGAILKRDYPQGQNFIHSAGAPCYFWYPLKTNVGAFEYSEELSDNMSVVVWNVRISGVQAPSSILKPEHLFAITYSRSVMQRLEENFVTYLIGIVDKVSFTQDTSQSGAWNIDVTCTSILTQTSLVPGVRMEGLDIASQGSINASSSLGASWKVTLPQMDEVSKGARSYLDLVEKQDDFEPDKMVDGNRNTFWMSDGWLGPEQQYDNDIGHNSWASIFAYPPPELPYGGKYIEIIHQGGLENTFHWIFAKWSVPGEAQPRKRWFQASENKWLRQLGIDEDALVDDDTNKPNEARLIIAGDASIFQENFPGARPTALVDASLLSGGQDMEAVRRLWWEGGAIFLRWVFDDPGEPFSQGEGYLWSWGNVTAAELEETWELSPSVGGGTTDFNLPGVNFHYGYGYSGAPFSPPKPGMVFRRILTDPKVPPGNVNSMTFTADFLHFPGYVIAEDITADDDSRSERRSEWFKLTLPGMSHFLRDNVTKSANPGDLRDIFVLDAQGLPNIEGLVRDQSLQPGGTKDSVIIDGDVITFTNKSYRDGKLIGCVVNAPHAAGTRVQAYWRIKAWGRQNGTVPTNMRIPAQDHLMDVASVGYPIAKIRWGRGYWPGGGPRTPFVREMVLRFSIQEDAPDPTTDSYENGYLSPPMDIQPTPSPYASLAVPNATLTIHGTPEGINLDTPYGFRPRTILFQLRKMANSAGAGQPTITARPIMNYVEVEVDRAYFNPQTWLDPGTTGVIGPLQIMHILQLSGQWGDLFRYYPDWDSLGRQGRKKGVTGRDTAWRVATGLAEYTSCRVICLRDGLIGIANNPFLYRASYPIQKSYTNTGITSIEVVNVRPAEIGQIRLIWETGFDENHGVIYWPSYNRTNGTIVEVGPLVAENEGMAQIMARNLYNAKRYPYNVFLELKVSDLGIKAGDIHQVTSDFLHNGELFTKDLLVETVSQQVSDLKAKTVLGYREIDRSNP